MDLLHLARAAAGRAARYLRSVERPADPAGWTLKGHHDFVTAVDRTAEELIAEVLLGAEPGSRILGEELTPELGSPHGLVWVVDPLDGTTNFLHDFPAYAVSIAAAVDGVLEAAVVWHVPLDRVFHAARGRGAWEGQRRLEVSSIVEPSHALLGTGFPFKHLEHLDRYLDQLRRLLGRTSGVRRAGSAALDLADVAAGRFDGFWELMLAPWDIAAGTLLVREAGGRVTDLQGRDLGLEQSPVVAGNPAIHGWLLGALADGARD
ncbi:MAG TPA: inositol monophosphatase family protein [Gemmatimonadales bacterium]|nr:inositol monophosphatase family protein [Gemmatimonadales bacterium]